MAELTPYDTGARLEPKVWFTDDTPETKDAYGKVDFEDDGGDTLVTIYAENTDIGYILNISTTDHFTAVVLGDYLVNFDPRTGEPAFTKLLPGIVES